MRSETTRWAHKNPVSNFLPSCGQSNWKEDDCFTFSSLCACGYWTYLGNREEQSIRDKGYYIPVTTPGCKKLDKPQGVLLLHLNRSSTYQHVMCGMKKMKKDSSSNREKWKRKEHSVHINHSKPLCTWLTKESISRQRIITSRVLDYWWLSSVIY
jgi:hypothetical protein